jgi:hypothetical protein
MALVSAPAFAQFRAEGLRGLVEDDAGSVLAGAQVTLIEVATSRIREAETDDRGRFQFAPLPSGEYRLIVTADGYQTSEVQVTIGREPIADVRVTLRVALSEAVTVTAPRAPRQTSPERNADAVRLDGDFLRGLPASGQDLAPLFEQLLSPAAQGASGVSLVIDGVEADGLSLPAGAIRRALVNRNPYAPEFRRPGKTRVEITTERGSSRGYRGDVRLLVRNAVFDARNAFAPTKPRGHRHTATSTLGGPLAGPRRAFFVALEAAEAEVFRVSNARTLDGPVVALVPAPASHLKLSTRVDQRQAVGSETARYDLARTFDRSRGVGGLFLPGQAVPVRQDSHVLQVMDRRVIGSALWNELRLLGGLGWSWSGAPADGTAVVVHGAFVGGSPQVFRSDRVARLELQNTVTYVRGRHSIRFGGQARSRVLRVVDQSNFGGTLEFSSVDDFAHRKPFVFRMNRGDPHIGFSLHDSYAFIQDDLAVSRRLSVLAGARYDWQSRVGSVDNIQPRVGIAIAPASGELVLRAGAGIFTERLPELAVARSTLHDGSHLQTIVIPFPSLDAESRLATRQVLVPSVIRLSADIRTPKLMQASVGVQRPLWRRTRLSIDVEILRGWRLFRSLNVNAPIPGSRRRPDRSFLNVDEIQSRAVMRSLAMNVAFQARVGKAGRATLRYAWSKTTNNTGGIYSLPADNYNLAAEMGRSDSDRRHQLSALAVLDLPGQVRLGMLLIAKSGAPFNITTGRDDNHDTRANDRPPGVTRNTGKGASFGQVDLRLTKELRITRTATAPDRARRKLELTIDVFNALNRVNAVDFVGVQTSPRFGQAVAASDARGCQLAVRYIF